MRSIFMGLSLILGFAALSAHAQNDPNKQALAKAQYMLRQLTDEKNKVIEENKLLKSELDSLKSGMQSLGLQHSNEKQESDRSIADLSKQVATLKSEIAEMSSKLAKQEHYQDDLVLQRDEQKDNFNKCYQNNKALYEINNELLGKYQGKGIWQIVAEKDSITSIQKVKVENLVQDYQYKMDDLQVKILNENELNREISSTK